MSDKDPQVSEGVLIHVHNECNIPLVVGEAKIRQGTFFEYGKCFLHTSTSSITHSFRAERRPGIPGTIRRLEPEELDGRVINDGNDIHACAEESPPTGTEGAFTLLTREGLVACIIRFYSPRDKRHSGNAFHIHVKLPGRFEARWSGGNFDNRPLGELDVYIRNVSRV